MITNGLKWIVGLFLIIHFQSLHSQAAGPYFESDSLVIHREIHKAYLSYLAVASAHPEQVNTPDNKLRSTYLQTLIYYYGKDEYFIHLQPIIDSAITQTDINQELKIIYVSNFTEIIKGDNLPLSSKLYYFNQALSWCDESIPRHQFYKMHLLHNRGVLLNQSRRYQEAESDLLAAIELAKRFDPNKSNMLGILNYNLGDLYINARPNNLKGFQYMELAEEALSQSSHPNLDYLSQTYNRLSDAAAESGDWEKARNYVIKSYSIVPQRIQDLDDPETMHYYYKLMQFQDTTTIDQALAILDSAVLIFTKSDKSNFSRIRMASIYNHMGELYVRQNPERSIPYYKKALAQLNPNDTAYALQYQFNLGKAFLYARQYQEAIRMGDILIREGIKRQDERLPYFYFLKANGLLYQRKLEPALDLIERVIDQLHQGPLSIDLRTHQNITTYQSDLGFIMVPLLIHMSKELKHTYPTDYEVPRIANALYQIALLHYQNNYPDNHLNAQSKLHYKDIMQGLFATEAQWLNADISLGQLITFSENAKARYLWQNFKTHHEPQELWNDSLVLQEQRTRSQLTELKQMNLDQPSAELAKQIFDYQLNLERIEQEKRNTHTSFYTFEEFDFDFQQFQKSIPQNAVYLKYELLDTAWYRFTIDQDAVNLTKINLRQTDFHLVEDLVQLISTPQSGIDEIHQLSERLGEVLIPKIPESIDHVVIEADGILHHMPFDILRLEETYLGFQYTISNTISLAFGHSHAMNKLVKSALIVAPSYEQTQAPNNLLAVRGETFDLQGALREAEQLKQLLPAKLLWKQQAVKATFMQQAPQFDLLHLAMHSFLNDEDPELSNLAFYDGLPENNKLHISELYGIPLKAQLAVLSACNTGIGQEHSGIGVTSMNRAFTYAGVPSVVSSLWSAPDQATSELMIYFYKNLQSNQAKDQALQQAKLSFLQNQEMQVYRHPYYWASFVIHGDTVPLQFVSSRFKRIRSHWIIVGILFVTGLFAIGYIQLNKS